MKPSMFKKSRLSAWFALALLISQQWQSVAWPRIASVEPVVAAAFRPTTKTTLKAQAANYAKLPLSFEANRGLYDARVKFAARQKGFTLLLTETEAQLGSLRMTLAGANRQPRLSGQAQLPGKVGYFLGNDPRQWQPDVPTYAQVKYEAVYPGIDLVYYGDGRQLEYDFLVAPQADPRVIKLRFAGARKLRLDANGDLLLTTKTGEVRQHQPVVYQESAGGRQLIPSRYQIKGNEVSFALGTYDTNRPLVIDPVLSYATFLGGNAGDDGKAIAVDAEGHAYVTGRTDLYSRVATTFPTTTGALQTTPDAEGAYIYVTKLNALGSALLYSAIIGGTQGVSANGTPVSNEPTAIAIDALGNAYVTGFTYSTNFPTTPGAIQSLSRSTISSADAFVLKLNPQGSVLTYSTLLGQGNAFGQGIAVDIAGQAWVTGGTGARDFPVTADAVQKVSKNRGSGAFVAKLNATATQLLYSTLLSSGSGESGLSIALDTGGNAYVSGTTGSSCSRAGDVPVEPFPTTEGAFRRDLGEGCPGPGSLQYVFVAKFSANGALVYSTLLGVSRGGAVAVDAQGSAYVAGTTTKLYNFPTTPGAYQTEISGAANTPAAFVVKLNPQGSALVYSTFLNGANAIGNGSAICLALDQTGAVALTGVVSASSFVPTTTVPPFDAGRGIFVAKLNPAGSALSYAVVLGEGASRGIALDNASDVYIVGTSDELGLPTTPGAFQTQRPNGIYSIPDAFIAKLSESAIPRAATHVSAASYTGARLASTSIIAAFGNGLALTTETATAAPLPMTLAGTTVKVRDSAGVERAAPLFFVSPGQVNYLLPPGTANGVAQIVITSGAGTLSTANVQIEATAPGLFTADASGRGLSAAVALRIKATGEQSYEPVARYDAAQNRMIAAPIELGAESDQVFLILFGTGWRNHSGLNTIGVKIGGMDTPVSFAGAQGDLAGLDQLNMQLPRSLAGRGEVDVVLTVNGVAANTVKVQIK